MEQLADGLSQSLSEYILAHHDASSLQAGESGLASLLKQVHDKLQACTTPIAVTLRASETVLRNGPLALTELAMVVGAGRGSAPESVRVASLQLLRAALLHFTRETHFALVDCVDGIAAAAVRPDEPLRLRATALAFCCEAFFPTPGRDALEAWGALVEDGSMVRRLLSGVLTELTAEASARNRSPAGAASAGGSAHPVAMDHAIAVQEWLAAACCFIRRAAGSVENFKSHLKHVSSRQLTPLLLRRLKDLSPRPPRSPFRPASGLPSASPSPCRIGASGHSGIDAGEAGCGTTPVGTNELLVVRDVEEELLLLLCELQPHLTSRASQRAWPQNADGEVGGSHPHPHPHPDKPTHGDVDEATALLGDLLASPARLLIGPDTVTVTAKEFIRLAQAQREWRLQQLPPGWPEAQPQGSNGNQAGHLRATDSLGALGDGPRVETAAAEHMPLSAACEAVLRAWASTLAAPGSPPGEVSDRGGESGSDNADRYADNNVKLRALRLGKAAVVARQLALDGPRSKNGYFLPNWTAITILVTSGLMQQMVAAVCDKATATAAPHLTAVVELLRCATAQLDEQPELVPVQPLPISSRLSSGESANPAEGSATAAGGAVGGAAPVAAAGSSSGPDGGTASMAEQLRGWYRASLAAVVSYTEDPECDAALVVQCSDTLEFMMKAVCDVANAYADVGFIHMLWQEGMAERLLRALPHHIASSSLSFDMMAVQLVDWSHDLQADAKSVTMPLTVEALLVRHRRHSYEAHIDNVLSLITSTACPLKKDCLRYMPAVELLLQSQVMETLAAVVTDRHKLLRLARFGDGAAAAAARLVGRAASHPFAAISAPAAQCRAEVGAALLRLLRADEADVGNKFLGSSGAVDTNANLASAATPSSPNSAIAAVGGDIRSPTIASNDPFAWNDSRLSCGAVVGLFNLFGFTVDTSLDLDPDFAAYLAKAGLVRALASRLGAAWADTSAASYATPHGLSAATALLLAYVDRSNLVDSGLPELEEAQAEVHGSLSEVVGALVGLVRRFSEAAVVAEAAGAKHPRRGGWQGGVAASAEAGVWLGGDGAEGGLPSRMRWLMLTERAAEAVSCLSQLTKSPSLGEQAAALLVADPGALEALVKAVAAAPRNVECAEAVTTLLTELWESKRIQASQLPLEALTRVLLTGTSDAVSAVVLKATTALTCPLSNGGRSVLYDTDLVQLLVKPDVVHCLVEAAFRRPLAGLLDRQERDEGIFLYDTADEAGAVLIRRLINYAAPDKAGTAAAPAAAAAALAAEPCDSQQQQGIHAHVAAAVEALVQQLQTPGQTDPLPVTSALAALSSLAAWKQGKSMSVDMEMLQWQVGPALQEAPPPYGLSGGSTPAAAPQKVPLLEAMVSAVLGSEGVFANRMVSIAQLVSAAVQAEAAAAASRAVPQQPAATSGAVACGEVDNGASAASGMPVIGLKLRLLAGLHARLAADLAAAAAGCLTRPKATAAAIGAVGKLLLVERKDGTVAPDPMVVAELERLGALGVVVELSGPSCQRHYGAVFRAALKLVAECASDMQGWRIPDRLLSHVVHGLGVRQDPSVPYTVLSQLQPLLLPGAGAKCNTELLHRLAYEHGFFLAAVAVGAANYNLSPKLGMAFHSVAELFKQLSQTTISEPSLRDALHTACGALLRLMALKLRDADAGNNEKGGYLSRLLDTLIRSVRTGGNLVDLRLMWEAAQSGALATCLDRVPMDGVLIIHISFLIKYSLEQLAPDDLGDREEGVDERDGSGAADQQQQKQALPAGAAAELQSQLLELRWRMLDMLNKQLGSYDQLLLEKVISGLNSFTRTFFADKYRYSADMLRWLVLNGSLPRMAGVLAAYPNSEATCKALCEVIENAMQLTSEQLLEQEAKLQAVLACLAPLCKALSSTTKAVVRRVLQTLIRLSCDWVAGNIVYTPAVIERLHSLDQFPRLVTLATSKPNIKSGVSEDIVILLRRLAWPDAVTPDGPGGRLGSVAPAAAMPGAAASITAVPQPGGCPPIAAAAAAARLRSVTQSLLGLIQGGRNTALTPKALLIVTSATTAVRGFYGEQKRVDVGLLRMMLGEGGLLAAVVGCLESKNGDKAAQTLCAWLRSTIVALGSQLDRQAAAPVVVTADRQSLAEAMQQMRDSLAELQAALPRIIGVSLSRLRTLEDQASIAVYVMGLSELATWRVDGAANVWAHDTGSIGAMAAGGLLRRLGELQARGASQPLESALSRAIGVALRTIIASGAACATEAVQVMEQALVETAVYLASPTAAAGDALSSHMAFLTGLLALKPTAKRVITAATSTGVLLALVQLAIETSDCPAAQGLLAATRPVAGPISSAAASPVAATATAAAAAAGNRTGSAAARLHKSACALIQAIAAQRENRDALRSHTPLLPALVAMSQHDPLQHTYVAALLYLAQTDALHLALKDARTIDALRGVLATPRVPATARARALLALAHVYGSDGDADGVAAQRLLANHSATRVVVKAAESAVRKEKGSLGLELDEVLHAAAALSCGSAAAARGLLAGGLLPLLLDVLRRRSVCSDGQVVLRACMTLLNLANVTELQAKLVAAGVPDVVKGFLEATSLPSAAPQLPQVQDTIRALLLQLGCLSDEAAQCAASNSTRPTLQPSDDPAAAEDGSHRAAAAYAAPASPSPPPPQSLAADGTGVAEKAYDVFLSHKRTDAKDFARALYNLLVTRGISTFLDFEYREELSRLDKIVARCANLVFILTDNVFQSEWCLKELEAAALSGVNIILVLKEGSRWQDAKGNKVCEFPPYELLRSLTPVIQKVFERKSIQHSDEYYASFVEVLLGRIKRHVVQLAPTALHPSQPMHSRLEEQQPPSAPPQPMQAHPQQAATQSHQLGLQLPSLPYNPLIAGAPSGSAAAMPVVGWFGQPMWNVGGAPFQPMLMPGYGYGGAATTPAMMGPWAVGPHGMPSAFPPQPQPQPPQTPSPGTAAANKGGKEAETRDLPPQPHQQQQQHEAVDVAREVNSALAKEMSALETRLGARLQAEVASAVAKEVSGVMSGVADKVAQLSERLAHAEQSQQQMAALAQQLQVANAGLMGTIASFHSALASVASSMHQRQLMGPPGPFVAGSVGGGSVGGGSGTGPPEGALGDEAGIGTGGGGGVVAVSQPIRQALAWEPSPQSSAGAVAPLATAAGRSDSDEWMQMQGVGMAQSVRREEVGGGGRVGAGHANSRRNGRLFLSVAGTADGARASGVSLPPLQASTPLKGTASAAGHQPMGARRSLGAAALVQRGSPSRMEGGEKLPYRIGEQGREGTFAVGPTTGVAARDGPGRRGGMTGN